jgi:DNA polymerase-1
MPNPALTNRPHAILIDGSSFLYRAYHAIPPMKNAQGLQVNAVYGVSVMLHKLIRNNPVDHIGVVFDAQGKNFRHDLYESYKANRPVMPDDLSVQVTPLHSVINAMGLPLFIEPGVEADDTLGALAQYAEQQGYQVTIATSDKDMAQLVTDNITLENTMANTRLDIEGVITKFGVKPELITDYLALIGDTVDNIPGVDKVGPKTATKWLGQYGSLENLMAHADEISGKVGDNLRNSLAHLPLSKQLATIKCDLGLPYAMADLKRATVNNEQLKRFAVEYGFPISHIHYQAA